MKDTITSIYEKTPWECGMGWMSLTGVMAKLDSMLSRHGNFSKVRVAELYPWLPYCIHPVNDNPDDHRYILLNRDYKPLGFVEDPADMCYRFNYAAFTHAHVTLSSEQTAYLAEIKAPLVKAEGVAEDPHDRYWIPDAGTQGCMLEWGEAGRSKKAMRAYASRLQKLLSLAEPVIT